jgi:hypothetical protein
MAGRIPQPQPVTSLALGAMAALSSTGMLIQVQVVTPGTA